MGLFGKLFGSKGDSPKGGSSDLERQLAELEEQARRAPLGFQGRPLNRAGDVCLQAGDRARALRYYGLAIDALLEDGQPEAARGVASKIIRVHPDAVRTLCTLTWLDLASRHMATAIVDVAQYAEAAKKAGRAEMAVPQIVEMARLVGNGEFLEAAAGALDTLEAESDAKQVRKWAKKGGSGDHVDDADEILELCLKAARGSNENRKSEGAVA